MNIGEQFYCSRCMSLLTEEVCPYCGYNGRAVEYDFALMEGTLLQNRRYELGAVVGVGGFGITYAAWDSTLQIPVAIKEYYPKGFVNRNIENSDEVNINEEQENVFRYGYEKFLKEARILGTLQNMKSVVLVRDWFEKNNTAYIVMEFLKGKSIDRYVEEHKLSPKAILEMLKPIMQELGQIHQQGILHRDISTSNLIVDEDGNVKLIDFGSALELKLHQKDKNTIVYNPDFAAPEQYETNGNIGPWTDVYGMSAVIYYLLKGEVFSKKTMDVTTISLPKWQKDILIRGLKSSTETRIQSMPEFYARLFDEPLPEEVKLREKIRKRQWKVIIFGGLLAFLLNLNAWKGLPLGGEYYYRLTYGGFCVSGVTDEWMSGDVIPEKRLFIPVTKLGGAALSVDSDWHYDVTRDWLGTFYNSWDYTVPGTIKSIEPKAFYSCGFELVKLEDGVEYIGEQAFASANRLQGIYIPASVTMIEDSAFDNQIEYFVIWGEKDSEAERYAKAKGIAFATKEQFVYDEDGNLEKYLGNDKNIVLPSKHLDMGYLVSMSSDVFSECEPLETVVLPRYLGIVPSELFKDNSSIQMVTVGDATQVIGAEAFANSSLMVIQLPEFLAAIEEKAFYQCAIRSVQWAESLLEIHVSAFQGTQLEEVTIPELMNYVGEKAFADCTNLKEVWVYSSYCKIEDSAFDNCSKDITFYGIKDSIAETYAEEHGYDFVVIKEFLQNEDNEN